MTSEKVGEAPASMGNVGRCPEIYRQGLMLADDEKKRQESRFVEEGVGFAEGKVGVNKPELLPKEFSTVIDVAGFLSDGQRICTSLSRRRLHSRREAAGTLSKSGSRGMRERDRDVMVLWVVLFAGNANCCRSMRCSGTKPRGSELGGVKKMTYCVEFAWLEKRLAREIDDIEKDTGFKLRVLAQNYPNTPGLAIKDFWQVDDRTIVFVADPTFGNIINFNVGNTVDLDIPRSFWSRLAGKYGNIFYWKEKGEDASIEAAVMAISNCLREPVGRNNCSEVK
ncbi:hypothetical protein RHSIM_Rhsim03G0092100 [Rhododendron simsii]|uniref:Thylakoid lumenal 15.0 kDa protein 2, chloroplastic n=1 Tax=Rhododendron simsii TaxID=118357 RepID=A0A834HA37_RHOSS|nr:hypothetical protein RHSIM_Rhsim03G0092100 [Rhododendron simsii]